MPAGGTYLPPVVAQITANADDFRAKLAQAKLALLALSSQTTALKLVADSKPFDGKIAAIRAMVNAMKLSIPVNLDTAAATAEMAVLKTAADKRKTGSLLSLLGFGGGAFGLAGIGSIGALAGFGPEHVAMTGVGLAGSAAGGALGGGLLGLGALGTMGVGMGSDILVAKEAMKQMTTQTAAFGALFNQVTSQAQHTFISRIATPVMAMAQTYFPLIGQAAQRNFGIIGTAIKPLLTFLSTQGHSIFNDLENVFARNLPTGVGIFVQSLELVLKTIDHIATSNNFGGFLQKILAFVTNLNTTGFGHFMTTVDKLIGLFHIWATFIGVLGRDIYDMFSQTVGLGSGIITTLTGMLNRLGEWERSASGKAAMHSLFEAHKQEVLALLALLPVLVRAVGPIYLQLSTTFTRLAIPIISMLVHVTDFLTHLGGGVGQVISFALGLALIEAKSHLLINTFKILTGVLRFTFLLTGLTRAFIATAQAEGIAAAAARVLGVSELAALGPIALIVIGSVALVAGLVLLVTHWKQVVSWLGQAVAWVRKTYTEHKLLLNIILILMGPVGALIKIVATVIDHWKQIVTWVGNAIQGFKNLVGTIGNVMSVLGNLIGKLNIVGNALNAINPFAKHSPSLVESVAAGTALIAGHYETMANRIGAHALRAKGYMSAFTPGTPGRLAGAGAGVGGGGRGVGAVNLYSSPSININGGGSPASMTSELRKELDKHTADLLKMLKSGAYLPGQGLP